MARLAATPIRILLADSTDLLLLGAQRILDAYADCQVLKTVTDFPALLAATRQQQPVVVVFGDCLDPELDVWEQVTQLNLAAQHTRLILVNNRVSGLLIRDLLAHGLDSVLCKHDALGTHLYPAVVAVVHNRPYLSPTAHTEYLVAMQSPYANERLDPEARQVLQLLAQGEHAGQIGERLGIHKRRVYWIREKLRRRFSAKTNEHLIQRAAAEGYIYPYN